MSGDAAFGVAEGLVGNKAVGRLIRLPSRSQGWHGDPPKSEPAFSAAGTRQDKPSLSVLLVEDEPGDARLVEFALQMSSAPLFLVKHVATLAAAIAHMQSGAEVDVILLDLSLPDSSGIQTVSRMQEVASKTPIVIMTGMDDPRFAATALEVGAQDYLIKSDDPEKTVGRAIRYAITRMAGQIERQTLLERIAEQQRHLVKEVEAARAMQFDLLPRPERLDGQLARLGLEVESFFEPSSGIGGDLWGCLDCGNGRMSFFTYDFTGHGIGAALNVFRLHALISDHWDPRQSPSETLRVLSAALRGLLGRGQFATMFLCTLDCERGEIEWASAGAPAPIIMERGEFRFLDTRGVPLGLSRAPNYIDHREPFDIGTSLLIYSDAITDAPVSETAMFGEAGLSALVGGLLAEQRNLRVEHLIDGLYGAVRNPLEDDLTAVCIRRLPRMGEAS
ncbi:Serine phosphatase RsbU, regulator of sigma subunit [Candidatus Terasakiella magnetica]|nr:Serine phosphatase RsbU, regulator of sigma subunit [Candidatus Terasakiella magnetica]